MKGYKYIFVGGSGRCGTGITWKMFKEHPELAALDEPKTIDGKRTWHPSQWAKVQTIYEVAMRDQEKGKLLVKDPWLVRYANELLEYFSNSFFIHVIRDPRDVCASVWTRKWDGAPRGDVHSFTTWYQSVMNSARGNQPKEHYIVVQMEEILHRPLEVLAKLFDYAGLSYNEKLLRTCTSLIHNGHIERYKNDLSEEDAAFISNRCEGIYEYWKSIAV